MSQRKIVYSESYYVDIGSHVFPTSKYRRIRQRLIDEDLVGDADFVSPSKARDEDILLVHTPEYLKKLKNGTLSREEIVTLELPYSKQLVEASLYCCGGTIVACQRAVEDGIGIHLGGGFHHAFPDHGEGFCVLNDIAIGIKRTMSDELIRKALVVDCDLHQGNGTAAAFNNDANVFTFSIHQENNYPFFKPKSTRDIGLRDGARDAEYLSALNEEVPKIVSSFKPELIVFVAGADPYREDQIGGLALTKEGLKKRDEFVFGIARNYSIPIALVLAGGYAYKQEDTVAIHYNTVATALSV
jgi:acetoin utilization deacetylase AcuC-like enzyme